MKQLLIILTFLLPTTFLVTAESGAAEISQPAAASAKMCAVPSAAYPDVDAALSDSTCEEIEIAASSEPYPVSYHTLTTSVIVNGAGRQQTVLKVIPRSTRLAVIQNQILFKNMTLRDGGQLPPADGLSPPGALFRVDPGGHLTLDNVLVTNNRSSFDGGAIESSGELTILNSAFTNNSAGGYIGSTSYAGGAVSNKGSMTVANSSFSGNFMFNTGNKGGAIGSSGVMLIEDSSFDDNNAHHGGAIFTNGRSTIRRTTLSDNSAQIGSAIESRGRLELFDSVIENNSAYGESGQFGTLFADGETTIVDSKFTGNISANGAAITNGDSKGIEGPYQSVMTIRRSSLEDNTALSTGGAIINYDTLTIDESTIANNTAATAAGAIFNAADGSTEVENSTISGNAIAETADVASAILNRGAMKLNNSTDQRQLHRRRRAG